MFDFNNPMSRGTSYPFGNGLDMSKLQPNPAAQARKPAAVDATAEGIAQVKRAMKLPAGVASSYNKKKTNCDPGEVSSRGVCKKKGRKKKASQDNSGQRLSSAGEESGVKYKIDADGDKTGRSAFDTLDNYMKKAGLNSFQSSFFSRMVLEGSNIEGAIKQAEDKFGEKVASELKSGFETLEKQGNIFSKIITGLGKRFAGKGAQKAVQQGVQKGVQQGAKGGQKALTGEVVKRLPGAKPPTSMVPTPNFRMPPGGAAPGLGQKALDAGKGFFTGAGAKRQLGQGAAMGAFNPFTGLMSDQAFDEQGNMRVGHLLKQTALGALGGRSLGKIPGVSQNIVRPMGNRMMTGSGVGYGAGIGANIAGYDVDPTTMAQLGFGGGALLPGSLAKAPGIGKRIQNMKPGKMKDFLSRELGSYGTATSKGVDPLSALSPLDLASNAALGAAGRAARPLGNAALRGGQAAAKGYRGLSPAAQANAKMLGGGALAGGGLLGGAAYLGNKMDQQANQFRQEMQPYLDGAAQTMNRTNQFMDNPVGGMLGGLGDTFKQNPWLLPLLLGGGGAALGGMAGGGTGATLGGIGLPLLYMMSQGKGLGDLFPGGQQNVAQTQQQLANQDESTRAAQQAQNPVATQNTDQQDEFARQGAQQFAEANPGMMDGGMFDFSGYDQDEMAQLFAKASPQQQRILQDPSIPEATKGQILEQIAQG